MEREDGSRKDHHPSSTGNVGSLATQEEEEPAGPWASPVPRLHSTAPAKAGAHKTLRWALLNEHSTFLWRVGQKQKETKTPQGHQQLPTSVLSGALRTRTKQSGDKTGKHQNKPISSTCWLWWSPSKEDSALDCSAPSHCPVGPKSASVASPQVPSVVTRNYLSLCRNRLSQHRFSGVPRHNHG